MMLLTCAMASGVLLSSSILRYRSVTFFSLSIFRSHWPSSVRCRAISLSYNSNSNNSRNNNANNNNNNNSNREQGGGGAFKTNEMVVVVVVVEQGVVVAERGVVIVIAGRLGIWSLCVS